MIMIKKDFSGVTFRFELINDKSKETILEGDGFESVEEIIEIFKEDVFAITGKEINNEEMIISITN